MRHKEKGSPVCKSSSLQVSTKTLMTQRCLALVVTLHVTMFAINPCNTLWAKTAQMPATPASNKVVPA